MQETRESGERTRPHDNGKFLSSNHEHALQQRSSGHAHPRRRGIKTTTTQSPKSQVECRRHESPESARDLKTGANFSSNHENALQQHSSGYAHRKTRSIKTSPIQGPARHVGIRRHTIAGEEEKERTLDKIRVPAPKPVDLLAGLLSPLLDVVLELEPDPLGSRLLLDHGSMMGAGRDKSRQERRWVGCMRWV